MTFGEELVEVVATLCFWADRGDEEAAVGLNHLATTASHEVLTAAQAIQADPLFQPRFAEWEMLGATVDLIAAHYRLDAIEVWGAVLDLERHLLAETGHDSLSDLLASADGISLLGARVARNLIGPVADAHPLLVFSQQ
jgi:hypothetical protein